MVPENDIDNPITNVTVVYTIQEARVVEQILATCGLRYPASMHRDSAVNKIRAQLEGHVDSEHDDIDDGADSSDAPAEFVRVDGERR